MEFVPTVSAMHYFNRITIQTPESVELQLTLAGIGNRTLALFVDYLIILATLIIFWLLWLVIWIFVLSGSTEWGDSWQDITIWLLAVGAIGSFVIQTCYFVYFEVAWQGRTPGKRFAQIRVIQQDGRRVTIQQAALRSLLLNIDVGFWFIGAILIVLTRQEKRLGDWVAGTLVIQDEQRAAPMSLAVSEAAQILAAELTQSANLSKLLPDDFATIREYLQRRPYLSAEAKSRLNVQLARQVRKIIELKRVPSSSADVFLEAVYLAYQQQH